MTSNLLNELAKFLNQGWVGALIGLFSLLLALYLFRSSQIFPRLAIQMSNTGLIGGKHAELPNNVTIYYQKDLSQPRIAVSHLSKTNIVIWNAGKTNFRGNDIVSGDPLRFEFDSNSQILDVKVTLVTRDSNLFTIHEDSTKACIAICEFDFLDPQDGVRIEILHTSNDSPMIYGTIRGLPQGLTNWGSLPIRDRQLNGRNNLDKLFLKISKHFKVALYPIIIFSAFITSAGFFPDLFLTLLPSLGKFGQQEPIIIPGKISWLAISVGILYGIPPTLILWSERRRFPKRLVE